MAIGAGPVMSLTSLIRTTVDMKAFLISKPLYNLCAINVSEIQQNVMTNLKWRYKTEINLNFKC